MVMHRTGSLHQNNSWTVGDIAVILQWFCLLMGVVTVLVAIGSAADEAPAHGCGGCLVTYDVVRGRSHVSNRRVERWLKSRDVQQTTVAVQETCWCPLPRACQHTCEKASCDIVWHLLWSQLLPIPCPHPYVFLSYYLLVKQFILCCVCREVAFICWIHSYTAEMEPNSQNPSQNQVFSLVTIVKEEQELIFMNCSSDKIGKVGLRFSLLITMPDLMNESDIRLDS